MLRQQYLYDYTGSWHHSFLNFISVGVTLEVGHHLLEKKLKWWQRVGKNSQGGLREERNPNLMLVQGWRQRLGSTVSRNVKMVKERREKILPQVRGGGKWEADVGVGVTLEVGSTASRKFKMVVERCEKKLWQVRGGEESESDVVVGVTLEVRLHRFQKKLKLWQKGGKRWWDM